MGLFFKKNIGRMAILALVFFPVARWTMISPLGYRFIDLNTAMTSFGQLAGLIGMALFSVNLILSCRVKFLEKYFNGLDKVCNQHHIIGALSFCLLLFHPLFLVVKYFQISLYAAAMFLLPSADHARNYGISALFFMIILMVMAFYIKLKYQRWKFFHKFMAAVFIFAILHALFITSDISRDNILRFYILGLSGIGLIAGLWQGFLRKK